MLYKIKRSLLFSGILIIALNACKKETTDNKHSGLVFYPAAGTKYSLNMNYGYKLENGMLTLPIWDIDSNEIAGNFLYDFKTKSLSYDANIELTDTSKIGALIYQNNGKYIGMASDLTKQFFYKGNPNSPDKFVILDKNYKTIKQKFIGDTISYLHFFKPMNNGRFLANYYSYAPVAGNLLVCFDENLDIKWKTNLNNFSANEVCIAHNSIYCLERSFELDQFFVLRQYYVNGKFIKARTSPRSNFEAKLINSETGINVFSIYSSTVKRNLLCITVYDNNLNVIKTKLLNTSVFSYNDAFDFKFNSNIIKSGNDYFLTVSVNNFTTQSAKTTEVKLVKINAGLEIEWVKPLDNTGKLYEPGYLFLDGQNLLYLGRSIWIGQEGYRFVQTDLNGSIVK